ncbi:hypothetical protein D3C73_1545120 [compost metagenome]
MKANHEARLEKLFMQPGKPLQTAAPKFQGNHQTPSANLCNLGMHRTQTLQPPSQITPHFLGILQ